MVVLHALGQCLIRTAITTITPRADMCFALASYLTRERGNRIPRRRLEQLLWPRMRAADASHSLSELIHKLRRKGVVVHRDDASCIWLPREAASIDVESLRSEPATTIASRDLSLLPGYEPRASAAFNDWVDEWRAQMRLRVLDDVIAAIKVPESAGDWQLCLALADQAIRIDPENELALLARARAAAALARQDTAAQRFLRTAPLSADPAQFHENHVSGRWPARYTDAGAGVTPFVGRDDTMARLRAHALPVQRGAVCSMYISGQAGVGKSRVVRELSAWLRASGAAVCVTACGRHDSHRPLSAFVHSVPLLQRLPGAAGCSPDALSCLESITQLSGDSASPGARDDSAYRPDAIRASVIDLVDAIADEQPLLLVVEDVHWIDPASWSLLRAIATTAEQSVLIVCTSRVRWQHASWGEPDTFALEELLPLGHEPAVAHMRNCVAKQERSADEAFVEWCVETSGGNPYFIEELVNYWITTGEQYSAPPSLVALVEARLACLTPDTLRVIQAAAILGRNSNLDLLERVLEFPTHVLLSSIEELGETDLLAASPPAKSASPAPVLCRHDIVINAATRGLSAHGRALLHHAAAKAIESVGAGSHSAELLWDCADHWRAAGQMDRSIRAAIACARHLHDMGLVHDAIKTCESALRLCQNNSSRASVLRAMAQSQYSARAWSAFCETVARVRALEGEGVSADLVHDELELCELNAQRSLRRDWNEALDRTLLCVQSPAADASHGVRAAITALKIASNIGASDVMDFVYCKAMALVNNDAVEISDRLTLEMIYHAIRGDPIVSGNAARELLSVARRELPARHRLVTLIDCAGALRRSGASDATRVFEELFDTAVQIGCFDHASDACQRLIEVYLDCGDMVLATKWLARYRRLNRPKSELTAQRVLRVTIARVHLRRHEWRAAANLIEPAGQTPLWADTVAMFRSIAIAAKIRLEIGRKKPIVEVAEWNARLAPLNKRLRTMGAQDYETFSIYLGYCYAGEVEHARALLINYIRHERRDKAPVSPEIAEELARLEATPGTLAAV